MHLQLSFPHTMCFKLVCKFVFIEDIYEMYLFKIILYCYSSLKEVSETVLVHFREAAEKMIEEKGAVDALAAALASISGQTDIKPRSLISSQEVRDHEIYVKYHLCKFIAQY